MMRRMLLVVMFATIAAGWGASPMSAAALPAPCAVTEDAGSATPAATTDAAAADAATATAPAAAELPAWMTMELKAACDGATFTLADFAGKTVYVQAFATTCGNCRAQLANVFEAQPELGEDVVVVVLSIDTQVSDEALVAYAEKHGYPFIYAAMSEEMLRALGEEFGREVAIAPQRPHFFLAPNGAHTELRTGEEKGEALVTAIAEFAAANAA